jgi:hypothetical protein
MRVRTLSTVFQHVQVLQADHFGVFELLVVLGVGQTMGLGVVLVPMMLEHGHMR